MANRRPTAGGSNDDGAGGEHGMTHRDHRPVHFQVRPWHRRSSGNVARQHHREDREHRGRAQFFGWQKPNRDRGERRRP